MQAQLSGLLDDDMEGAPTDVALLPPPPQLVPAAAEAVTTADHDVFFSSGSSAVDCITAAEARGPTQISGSPRSIEKARASALGHVRDLVAAAAAAATAGGGSSTSAATEAAPSPLVSSVSCSDAAASGDLLPRHVPSGHAANNADEPSRKSDTQHLVSQLPDLTLTAVPALPRQQAPALPLVTAQPPADVAAHQPPQSHQAVDLKLLRAMAQKLKRSIAQQSTA